MNVKQCQTCHELKPVSEYHRCKARADGLQDRCKRCNLAAVALSRSRTDPVYGTARLRYYASHRDMIQTYNRAYWLANRQRINIKRKAKKQHEP